MKIKMLKLAASPKGVLHPGVIYDLEDSFAKSLVEADAAEYMEKPKPFTHVERAVVAPVEEKAVEPFEVKKPKRKPKRKKAE